MQFAARHRWVVSAPVTAVAGCFYHLVWGAVLCLFTLALVRDWYFIRHRDRRYGPRHLRFRPWLKARFAWTWALVQVLIYNPARAATLEVLPPELRPSSYIPQAVKQAVTLRDKGRCQCGGCPRCTGPVLGWAGCGYAGPRAMEYDHLIARARGGANTERNIRLLCPPCNNYKSDKLLQYV